MRYVLATLDRRHIDQAFPLVRTVCPDLDPQTWRAFAERHVPVEPTPGCGPTPTGIMTVRNASGHIYGLFCYAIAHDLRHGPTLAVSHLIVIDLFDVRVAVDALLDGMDYLASPLGCRAIHVDLSDPMTNSDRSRTAIIAHLRRSGHRFDAVRFCKTVNDEHRPPV